MALKFLNKKGWHTGSLRNIENVWKAEQKHDAEQKKLEELRKQIQEEREKSEFRLLQEQAGLVPKQERLDFLYESGLAVGKGSSDGFKALESYPKVETSDSATPAQQASKEKEKSSAPGALFEDKPQSANDAWRKLHSDPLLLIRQREQEALARIKNNPIQMANIRKSVEEKKKGKKKKEHGKHSSKKSKHEQDDASEGDDRKKSNHRETRKREKQYSESDSETEERRKRAYDKYSSSKDRSLEKDVGKGEERRNRSHHHDDKKYEMYSRDGRSDLENEERKRSYGKYSSSKDRRSERDVADLGDEARNRSRYRDGKRDETHSPNGRSDSETEERKRNYDKYSSFRDRRSETDAASHGEERRYRSDHRYDRRSEMHSLNCRSDSDTEEKRTYDKYASSKGQRPEKGAHSKDEERAKRSRHHDDMKPPKNSSNGRSDSETEERRERNHEKLKHESHSTHIAEAPKENLERTHQKQRRPVTKLSEEEKAARLREMQMDAVLHEEQRWKRLKKAEKDDALEASKTNDSRGQNFLNAAQKSVYGAEKGGSSTIEESVRRRKYFSQGRSESNEGNAFRR